MATEVQRKDLLPIVLDVLVRLSVIAILLYWSYLILQPFIMAIIWGIIIAVACSSSYEFLVKRLNGRRKLAAAIFTLAMLAAIIVPSWFLGESLYSGVASLRDEWEHGNTDIPPPTEQVKSWPIVGEKVYALWKGASINLSKTLTPFSSQLSFVAKQLLAAGAGLGATILQFVLSIVICSILLVTSERGAKSAKEVSARLGSDRGRELLKDAEITVKNVARGIIGVALIQTVLAGVGMAVAGIPGAGFWALVCLVFCVIQVGTAPVLGLACVYMFSTSETTPAVIFLIWSIFVSALDNILKPILLGKGAPAPMLVIFLGAIGGFVHAGIIGLFVGAVVLSLAYKLVTEWIEQRDEPAESSLAG